MWVIFWNVWKYFFFLHVINIEIIDPKVNKVLPNNCSYLSSAVRVASLLSFYPVLKLVLRL